MFSNKNTQNVTVIGTQKRGDQPKLASLAWIHAATLFSNSFSSKPQISTTRLENPLCRWDPGGRDCCAARGFHTSPAFLQGLGSFASILPHPWCQFCSECPTAEGETFPKAECFASQFSGLGFPFPTQPGLFIVSLHSAEDSLYMCNIPHFYS